MELIDVYNAVAPMNGQEVCLQLKGPMMNNTHFDDVLREHLGSKGVRLMPGSCKTAKFDSQFKGFDKVKHGIHITLWMH